MEGVRRSIAEGPAAGAGDAAPRSLADGTTAWRLLRSWRAFNALLADNPGASVVMIVCHAADGELLPYTSADHNGGFDTYLPPDQGGRTQRIASPHTRSEADEIESYRKSSP